MLLLAVNRAMLQQAWRGVVSDSWTFLSTYSTTVTLRDTKAAVIASVLHVRPCVYL